MTQFAHPNLSFHQSRRGQNPIFLNHCFTLIYWQRGHASTQPHVEHECSTFLRSGLCCQPHPPNRMTSKRWSWEVNVLIPRNQTQNQGYIVWWSYCLVILLFIRNSDSLIVKNCADGKLQAKGWRTIPSTRLYPRPSRWSDHGFGDFATITASTVSATFASGCVGVACSWRFHFKAAFCWKNECRFKHAHVA